jgi:branched-chain amino acid transport system substrate-binding protein
MPVKPRHPRLLGGLAASALLVTTAACGGGGGEAGGGDEIVIGSLLPKTGDLAALGKNTATAVQLAVKQANAAEGDVSVKLVAQDAGTQESIAQSAVQQILSQNADAIVGAVSSAVCLSVIDTVVQSEVLMISPACTTPQLSSYDDGGLFFRTAAPSDAQGSLLADVAYQDGKRRVAVMSVRNSYGQSIGDRFVERFKELGGQIVANVQYDATGKSFTAETQQVASAKPDAVVLVGYVDTGAAIVHDAAQRGLLDLQWYTGDGIQDDTFPKEALPSDPEQLYAWKGIGIGSVDSPAADAFATAYQDEFGSKPPSFAAQAYDAAWIDILAAVRAKDSGGSIGEEVAAVTDPEGTACVAAECLPLVAQGKSVNYDGATGQVRFDDNGDPSQAAFAIWKFGPDGIETVRTISSDQ